MIDAKTARENATAQYKDLEKTLVPILDKLVREASNKGENHISYKLGECSSIKLRIIEKFLEKLGYRANIYAEYNCGLLGDKTFYQLYLYW